MAILGGLEMRIMEILWQQENPVSVREIHEDLLKDRTLAYTTVMTVLDRLAKKGITHREREGRAWLYVAGFTRAELVVTAMREALADSGPEERTALTSFAQTLPGHQQDLLRSALSGPALS